MTQRATFLVDRHPHLFLSTSGRGSYAFWTSGATPVLQHSSWGIRHPDQTSNGKCHYMGTIPVTNWLVSQIASGSEALI